VKELFTDICDSVRSKTGTTEGIKHDEIPEKILSIQGEVVPPEVDVSYMYFLERNDLSISAHDKIKALEQDIKNHPNKVFDLRHMFDMSNNQYSYLNFKNIKNVINASYLFANQKSITNLDLSTFDTSNTIDMNNMFNGCSKLITINTENWNTSNVVDMNYMFYGCNSLKNLDVSNFDTSNVVNMKYMFGGCNALTSLNVSNFDVSNALDLSYMFYGCNGLTSLNVSNFDISSEKNVSYMFNGCSKLTSLDLSNWNVSNTPNIFANCGALRTLKLGKNFKGSSSIISWFNNSTYQSIDINMNGNTDFSTYSGTSTLNLASVWRGNSSTYVSLFVNFANSLGICSSVSTKQRTIKIYTNLYNALSAEQKALITDKGYNLTYATS
jgi:surface protein